VVKTANLRYDHHGSEFQRLHGPRFRCVLGQREVRPGFVIIRQKGLRVPVQGSLVENDHVVKTLAANRTDDAFYLGTLPRRSRRRQNFLDSYGFHICRQLTTVDSVAVPKQVTRDLLKRKGLPELLRRPLDRRVTLKCTIRFRS
jgi:hypothetical protein